MEHEISKQEMDSMKALAEVNIKISDAQNLLFKLQETETEYLVEREEKAMDRIQNLLKTSKDILDQVDGNYQKVKQFATTVASFSDTLHTSFDSFVKLLADFKERSELWNKDVEKTEEDFANQKKQIRAHTIQLDNDAENNKRKEKILEEERLKIESDRGLIKRTIERLKNNRV